MKIINGAMEGRDFAPQKDTNFHVKQEHDELFFNFVGSRDYWNPIFFPSSRDS